MVRGTIAANIQRRAAPPTELLDGDRLLALRANLTKGRQRLIAVGDRVVYESEGVLVWDHEEDPCPPAPPRIGLGITQKAPLSGGQDVDATGAPMAKAAFRARGSLRRGEGLFRLTQRLNDVALCLIHRDLGGRGRGTDVVHDNVPIVTMALIRFTASTIQTHGMSPFAAHTTTA